MKTVGIIGGLGPESTVEYYRLIIQVCREEKPDGSYPPIIINSIDLKSMLDLVESNDWPGVAQNLVAALQQLARAGADFGLISANTPHIVFDEVQRRSPIPLISIVEATCDTAKGLGLKRAGLLGTRFTMQARFYPEVFSRAGIEIVLPEQDDQNYIHEHYLGELIKGVFLPQTRDELLGIVDRMKKRNDIGGLILGGTELPLILTDSSAVGIPFLDTTRIHVRAIVNRMLSPE